MKPIIGITMTTNNGQYCINEAYVKSILQAGGIPVNLPFGIEQDAEQLLDGLDGLLLTGGVDVHPHLFNEEPHLYIGHIMVERDEVELRLLEVALKKRMPIFGICRGIQVLNIALGGNLYQDINSQYEKTPILHTQKAIRKEASHYITIERNSKLYNIVGQEKIAVNSIHHQALKKVAEVFEVTAQASDGIIEAIEMKDYPYCVGVQWHPEEMAAAQDENAKKLFASFIDACSGKSSLSQ
ncbi:gamma-glutamyl-gamma-aminobutyrate hydrolase family protein [Lysinibacillus yapensis]|uniref:Gamma-glutamyl-gamma-aminobutyrate hydrolase family protein n=2 Tax=Ureibacillus yapensis TaxID=2304605 RepID=A0A396SE81_9BACL|nr:gamma-glutamyl-gamma-aminobutyrate hydrolase family protein [Lysinibacillus yapensis]